MRLDDDHPTYYDILELTPGASPQEIRSAYLRLKSAYGKDSLALYSLVSSDDTDAMLKQIEEAYIVLSHPERRRGYDEAQGLLPSKQQQPMATITPIQRDISFSTPTPQRMAPVAPPMAAAPTLAPSANKGTEIELAISIESEWSGPFLKRVREARGVSLDLLCEHTRISRPYLMAIEDDDYAKLPASVYLRGFLIQIAKRLKIPQDPFVSAYLNRFKNNRPDKG